MEGQEQTNKTASPVEAVVIRFRCWWLGCNPDYSHAMPRYDDDNDYGHSYTLTTPCKRCKKPDISYENLCGDSRKRKFEAFVIYWLYRKWWPRKCHDCKKRFGNHEGCLPF